LPDGVTAARVTLNHLVLVRIQVRQLLNSLQNRGYMGRLGTLTGPLDTNLTPTR
jgi:hypothetical protein